jgi:hypothetical protein
MIGRFAIQVMDTWGVMRRAVVVTLFAFILGLPAQMAYADDWGCQVLLCLSDARGPETESQCVPPIEKLWDALSKGHPFPTCDMMASFNALAADIRALIPQSVIDQVEASDTHAENRSASGSYCNYSLMYYSNLVGPACRAGNVIDVVVDGKTWTRVWWGIGSITGKSSSLTESYANGGVPVDPAQAAANWWRDYQARMDNPNYIPPDQNGGNGNSGIYQLFNPHSH